MKAEKEHIDELIAAYLSNGLDEDAQKELKAWMAESAENERYFMQQQEIWFSAVSAKEELIYNKEKAFGVFKVKMEQSKGQKKKKYVWRVFYKYVAAILVLGLISYFSYWRGESNLKNVLTEVDIEVEAPLGSQTKLRLPDGTSVVLNAGSRITYPQDFGVDSRDVKLQGEGYFEVTHNPKIPFNVRTKDLHIRVLGTKFNFRDYPGDKEAIVSLLEGKIALDNRLRREAELILLPNECVILDKKVGVMRKELKKSGSDLKWIDGILSFDEVLLPEVVQILERNYGVRITFANDSLKELRFYGNFSRTDQSIKEILEALSATEKVRYILKNKEITLY